MEIADLCVAEHGAQAASLPLLLTIVFMTGKYIGENDVVLETLLLLAIKEQIDIDHVFAIERQLVVEGIDAVWLDHSVSDAYGLLAACFNVQLTAPRELMLANISMFAYLKTGHERSKLAIALASLVVLCELEGCSDTLIARLKAGDAKVAQMMDCCRADVQEVRRFFLDNLGDITDDVNLIKRLNRLQDTALPF